MTPEKAALWEITMFLLLIGWGIMIFGSSEPKTNTYMCTSAIVMLVIGVIAAAVIF
jgi:hypothetical protein